ncbi:MAG: hypothetical protein XD77_0605 [Marinimicrobia bacterium 46_47]|nr:MAG: hypothetical protein XD77_0605 [Marinimicrobia bacterium 46_47]KUK91658.1 MAG: hypothetical protein XE04_0928 [Marinimicrobia bacterium 46_43]HBY18721.1 hypothetical protein [Candidatus Neomarinimicrobiota bacterium]
MKIQHLVYLFVITVSTAAAQVPPASDALYKDTGGDRYYTVDEEILQLKNELRALKEEVLMYKAEVNMPKIRNEIREMVTVPDLAHQIILKNGTIVLGTILEENLYEIKVQTLIGIITLQREQIKKIEPIKKQVPMLEFDGPVREMTYTDKKVFLGKVTNNGNQRADFVRVVFRLYDEVANLISADSSFVLGNDMKYPGGIYSSSSLLPGNSGNFQCSVPTLDKKVSYYTSEIKYSNIE